MFGSLKNKLKKVVSTFSKKVESEAEEVKPVEQPKPEKKKESKPKKEKAPKKEEPEEIPEPQKEKKGFFSKIKKKVSTVSLSDSKFEDLFWDIELELLENNVAVEVIEKLKEDLKESLVNSPIKRGDIESTIKETLIKSLDEILSQDPFELLEKIKSKRPYTICFIGINGSGKTTTIGKVANLIQSNKMTCVLAAADTFRAAAIDQLKEWGSRLSIKVIAQDYGSDPAAVAYDAIAHAKAQHINCVLVDTAGRLHANKDLMNEMKKIIKVSKPDLKIFIGESITGNDCVEQAKEFNESVGIDGIILSKADVDDKGGAAISVSYVTKKPILYLGTGQEPGDLEPFNKEKILKQLGLK
jgi:fused signal recognition particle receptor